MIPLQKLYNITCVFDYFTFVLPLLPPLILVCSLHSCQSIWCRRGAVWCCSAGFWQCVPQYVWRVCPVDHGAERRWQGQSCSAGGARESLAWAQNPCTSGRSIHTKPIVMITKNKFYLQGKKSTGYCWKPKFQSSDMNTDTDMVQKLHSLSRTTSPELISVRSVQWIHNSVQVLTAHLKQYLYQKWM